MPNDIRRLQFGRKLTAIGVSIENRQDHRLGRITTHYSAAELSRLLEAANRVCDPNSNSDTPEIVVLRRISAN